VMVTSYFLSMISLLFSLALNKTLSLHKGKMFFAARSLRLLPKTFYYVFRH